MWKADLSPVRWWLWDCLQKLWLGVLCEVIGADQWEVMAKGLLFHDGTLSRLYFLTQRFCVLPDPYNKSLSIKTSWSRFCLQLRLLSMASGSALVFLTL